MAGDNTQQYDNYSMKWALRGEITMRVLQFIENKGNLYRAATFENASKNTNNNYIIFIDSFYKLFDAVGLFTKNYELLANIEGAFVKPDIKEPSPENINIFLNLSSEFIVQLKEAGVYDPAITHFYTNPNSAWEGST